jgi:DNA-binding transcriptional regulator YhcF (GntR family)
MSQASILETLLIHRYRLEAGDKLPRITEIAQRASIHRDTIYALLNGDRVCQRTQYTLSRVLKEVEQETFMTPKTKLMSLVFNQGRVSLQIGLGNQPLLKKRYTPVRSSNR